MKRTALVESVMKQAGLLKDIDGKKLISGNYFLIAVLDMLIKKENNSLPGEVSTAESLSELEATEELISPYGIDYVRAISGISNAVTDAAYKSTMDDFVFSKIEFTAASAATRAGKDEIDLSVLVGMVLEDPTPAIQEYIIFFNDKKSDNGDKVDLSFLSTPSDEKEDDEPEVKFPTTPEEIAAVQSTLRSFFDSVISPSDSDDSGADKTSEPAEPNGNETQTQKDTTDGIERLAETVRNTRKIQSTLLKSIFGQDRAVNAFVSGYFQAQLMAQSRKGTRKPQATFLFAGPPGVGKTFLAEMAAQALGLPFKRFDMSEYADKEANIEFCGSDKVYKNAKAGNITEFVEKNPKCVLLFDEIEKAHINVIYLFLQMLDAGRLRDNYTDTEVSFTDATIIFTTNVGKNLYDASDDVNLSALPRKKILKALASDTDPATGTVLFPAAICSRFASGNVVMFNHLAASNLFTIAKRELDSNIKGFEESTGIEINLDDKVAAAIMLSEGGKADARTVKGRANAFFHEELYELFRLISAGKSDAAVESLKQINVDVSLDGASAEVASMFVNRSKPEVLIFADGDRAAECRAKLSSVECHITDSVDEAKDILFNHDVLAVVCDVKCKAQVSGLDLLNAEDVDSAGRDFITYVLEKHTLPVYLLADSDGDITDEEFLSFANIGVKDIITVNKEGADFEEQVLEKCDIAYRQSNMLKLARENKLVSYRTSQTVSADRSTASIHLFDFKLALSTDTEDSGSILDNISKPDLSFDDVIGAEDAKVELKFFVDYMKDPVKYMRRGVRAPKGILLYGPPGTGKTLLAKAMAGESDVTFLTAEGNQFLKKYVGEGADAVHSLFNAARKYAPSILFVDEIDAIAKDRSKLTSDVGSDVLTAFLTEMDGFNTDSSKPVFVLAATNYDVEPGSRNSLDPALLRRFDRRIYVDLPNKEERKRYLLMKMKKNRAVKLSDAQIDNIALRSTGMSLAELESVFEMALRNAIRTQGGIVGDEAFEEAFETFNSGEKKTWNPEHLKRTARHEAGHALLCWLSGEKPSYLTIVARGDHGGYMQHGDHEDKAIYTRAELLSRIRTSLAGRAAEIVYYGDEDGISTGASGDLRSATRVAEQMICSYGMEKDVGMSYINTAELSSQALSAVRERVNSILCAELERAIEAIRDNLTAVDEMVDALMEKNHLKENEIDEIFAKNTKK